MTTVIINAYMSSLLARTRQQPFREHLELQLCWRYGSPDHPHIGRVTLRIV